MDNSERYVITLQYLIGLFEYFNQELFNNDLQKPVITIQADTKNRENGWVSKEKVWLSKENKDEKSYELNISSQFLNREWVEIAESLLHEMCHVYAKIKGIKEVSRNGKYHNKKYKEIAEKHGLFVDITGQYGYAETTFTDETLKLFNKYIENHNVSPIYRLPMMKGKNESRSNARKYVCSICGCSVRATKEVNILCVDCNNLMTEEK